jgi:hypothetical protein
MRGIFEGSAAGLRDDALVGEIVPVLLAEERMGVVVDGREGESSFVEGRELIDWDFLHGGVMYCMLYDISTFRDHCNAACFLLFATCLSQ